MKRLYISDAVHEHLKQEAKRQGRTLQWVVEDRLTVDTPTNIGAPEYAGENITESKNNQHDLPFVPTPNPPLKTQRTKSEILKDIDAQKTVIADLENQTQINQDPDLLELITAEKLLYDELWKEYNELTKQ